MATLDIDSPVVLQINGMLYSFPYVYYLSADDILPDIKISWSKELIDAERLQSV